MRLALCLGLGLVAACGNPSGRNPDARAAHDAGSTADAGPLHDAGAGAGDAPIGDAATLDAPPSPVDAFPGVLDLRIDCHNDCVLTADPAAIAVPAGTSFEVNWINVGDTECDVAKIDEFNHVPIIIGLEPGTSYHDPVHDWCGSFTGTFDFRVSICTLHSYIPVDCDGP